MVARREKAGDRRRLAVCVRKRTYSGSTRAPLYRYERHLGPIPAGARRTSCRARCGRRTCTSRPASAAARTGGMMHVTLSSETTMVRARLCRFDPRGCGFPSSPGSIIMGSTLASGASCHNTCRVCIVWSKRPLMPPKITSGYAGDSCLASSSSTD